MTANFLFIILKFLAFTYGNSYRAKTNIQYCNSLFFHKFIAILEANW